MNKKKRLCVFLICAIVTSMCRFMPAAAAVEIVRSESEVAVESEPIMESEAARELLPGQSAEPETETKPTIEPLTEQSAEPETEPELTTKPEITAKLPQTLYSNTTADLVSTGAELINWLETHKNTGGTVRLTDNIVLDGYYVFCPDTVNMPALFVDADCYTITVTGEVTFMSDAHLTFYGQAQEKGIFQVAKGGLLSLENIAVEGGQNALWQEEGAGMVVANCRVAGNVHYADMLFVITAKTDCVLVEKGQTAGDVLPAQIKCSVNRQGEVRYNELLPVSWNLEEGKTQQKKRLRFEAQGAFLDAASKEPLSCTVAYHDYPLTFLDVKAIQNETQYLFRGGYAKPVEELPIQVASEYSFDGKNWTTYDEKTVSEALDAFFIGFEAKQWDTAKNPYVYIRLRWNDNGKKRFSNVLRYAAQNLSYAEDQGGSRGGGTSIVNPPDEPQKNTETKPSNETKSNTGMSNAVQSEMPSDTQNTEPVQMTEAAEVGQSSQIGQPSQPVEISSIDDQNSQKVTADDKTSIHEGSYEAAETVTELFSEEPSIAESMQETVPAAVLITETGNHTPSQMQQSQTSSNVSLGKTAAIGAGFAALCVVFAAAGYGLYAAKKRVAK